MTHKDEFDTKINNPMYAVAHNILRKMNEIEKLATKGTGKSLREKYSWIERLCNDCMKSFDK